VGGPDVVKQMEELTQNERGRKVKNYASAAMLYDLDGECSIKTMHEKNDGVINLDEIEDPAVVAEGQKQKGSEEDVSMLGEEDALDGVESNEVTRPQAVKFSSRMMLVAVLEMD
jgi:hypothetical protein